MRIVSFVAPIALLGIVSCATPSQTGVNYLENVRDTTIISPALAYDPVIRKGDLLSIVVYSASTNPATDAPYNLPQSTAGGGASSGFLVNAEGNIEYPRIGTIRAEGMTKGELEKMIKGKLDGTQLTNPSVIVRFLNFKITMLGDVNAPGTYTIPSERVTILEALGMAGDLKENARKNRIKVLRENGGQKELTTLDITQKDIFNSPYYLLQQNDVVIVEQTPETLKQRSQQTAVQQIGIVTGIITTIALILNFIR